MCPDDPNLPYDMVEVVKKLVDEGNLFEVRVSDGRWMEGGCLKSGSSCEVDCFVCVIACARRVRAYV